MPALQRNPSSMTKERLAEELKKNNIPLPRGRSKKEVYVELYQRHLLDGEEAASSQWTSYRNMSVNTSPKLGFSSDEDEDEVAVVQQVRERASMNVNNNRSQKRASRKANKAEFEEYLTEAEALSDADLRRELQQRGEKPGPIVASTRAVYERQLADLLVQMGQAEEEEDVSQEAEEYEGDSQENEDQYSDSDVDDTLILTNQDESQSQESSRSFKSRTTSSHKSHVSRVIEQESSTEARQRSVTPKRKAEAAAAETEKGRKTEMAVKGKEEKGKPLVPVWLQILIFLIIAAFLVLIWYNMETGQATSPLVT